jgi:hypothetical protein
MINIMEIDALTGETTIVELTKKEIADREAAALASQAELEAELAAKSAAKQAVLDRLGITAEEAALILG